MQNASAPVADLACLRANPDDLTALRHFAASAGRQGFRQAACTALHRAAALAPHDADIPVQLGHVLLTDRQFAAARDVFCAALARAPGHVGAWRGLGAALLALNEAAAAEAALRRGFAHGALEVLPAHGAGPHVPVLLLVSVHAINLVTAALLDPARVAVSALYVEYARPRQPLPPHALVLNAIADADAGAAALTQARALLAGRRAPVLNPPDRVRHTGRADMAARLRGLDGVVVPDIEAVPADHPGLEARPMPYLLRQIGLHAGQMFDRIETAADLRAFRRVAGRQTVFAISALQTRGPDGLHRKYRVMLIGGAFYPIHLVHAPSWKVHGFSAPPQSPAQCAEEAAFLSAMPRVLGPRRMRALAAIADRLGLDYAGIDFTLTGNDMLLVFEANAAMTLLPPRPGDVPPARARAMARALNAAQAMLLARAMPMAHA